jgi:hypothetical protein
LHRKRPLAAAGGVQSVNMPRLARSGCGHT